MRRNAVRTLVALMIGALASLLPVLAPASTAAPVAYPATVCATVQVSTTTPFVGESITVTGINFVAGASVRLELKPVAGNTTATGTVYVLRTVTASSSGAFSTTVTMPDATTSQGNFLLYAATGAPTNTSCPADPVTQLSLGVAGAGATNGGGTTPGTNSSGPGSTAFTGVNIAVMVLVAIGLIGAGVFFTRRGRTTTAAR